MEEQLENDATIIEDEINELLGKLTFLEEESVQVISIYDGQKV